MSTKPAKTLTAALHSIIGMSNLRPSDSGVSGAIIWVSAGEFEGKTIQHGPRIKVVLGVKVSSEGLKDAVTVTITKPPRVLGTLPANIKQQVVTFVELNYDVLVQYWTNAISTKEMLGRIIAVGQK